MLGFCKNCSNRKGHRNQQSHFRLNVHPQKKLPKYLRKASYGVVEMKSVICSADLEDRFPPNGFSVLSVDTTVYVLYLPV